MKRNISKIIIFILIILVVLSIIFMLSKKNSKTENYESYEPEEEITDAQNRQTLVSLFFINKNTRAVEPEARLVDVKDLVENPYGKLLELLIASPRNENLESGIPQGTVVLGTEMKGNVLLINFSEEFINNHKGGKDEEEKTMETIVNTLTELTEVNEIKILINGEENREFNDREINFNENFIRND